MSVCASESTKCGIANMDEWNANLSGHACACVLISCKINRLFVFVCISHSNFNQFFSRFETTQADVCNELMKER